MRSFILLILCCLVLVGCTFFSAVDQKESQAETIMRGTGSVDVPVMLLTDTDIDAISGMIYGRRADLVDVTGGKAHGVAQVTWDGNRFVLKADFVSLPQIDMEKFFYQGWLVRREPASFVSMGRLDHYGGQYRNIFATNENLMGYEWYVVTLEPSDDGVDGTPNPWPSGHVLEGGFVEFN